MGGYLSNLLQSIFPFGNMNSFGAAPAAQAPVAGAAAGDAAATAVDTSKGFMENFGGAEGLETIFGGIEGLGNLYTAIQSLGMAQDTFDFNKKAWETNLANQTQTYNTSLEDTIRSRYVTEGKSDAEADNYISKHSL